MPIVPLISPSQADQWLIKSDGKWAIDPVTGKWRIGTAGDKCCCGCQICVTFSGIEIISCVGPAAADYGSMTISVSGINNTEFCLDQNKQYSQSGFGSYTFYNSTNCTGTPLETGTFTISVYAFSSLILILYPSGSQARMWCSPGDGILFFYKIPSPSPTVTVNNDFTTWTPEESPRAGKNGSAYVHCYNPAP